MAVYTHIRRCAWVLSFAVTGGMPAVTQAEGLVPSVSRGQQLVESRCFACHSLDTHRVGPALGGVVGRKAGKAEGFVYSKAMTAATHTWNAAGIKAWLTDPEKVVPGQAMNYRLDEAQDREDVVAYLVRLSTPAKNRSAGNAPD
ncbi:c-type cytochrome [Ottowia thiooxydans]|uniref:c-type cytochrome n=1 Tax=Ottowia thiooxydans TaxID=219182 RepID=UPI001FE0015F|nr:c-type cytochrome [Ottowia thiooxydans]